MRAIYGGGDAVYVLEQVSYLIGHDSLLGGVSSSPLLSTAEERFNHIIYVQDTVQIQNRLQRMNFHLFAEVQANLLHW